MNVQVTCFDCGSQIIKLASRIKKNKFFFCNKVCQNNYYAKQSTKVVVKCNLCQKNVVRTKNQRRNSKTGLYFCGTKCKNVFIANSDLKRSKSTESHRCRKDKILKAAGNRCQHCHYDLDVRMLDIHHHDKNHDNNKYENLRVLCVWCHTLHHRTGMELNLPILLTEKDVLEDIKNKVIHFPEITSMDMSRLSILATIRKGGMQTNMYKNLDSEQSRRIAKILAGKPPVDVRTEELLAAKVLQLR